MTLVYVPGEGDVELPDVDGAYWRAYQSLSIYHNDFVLELRCSDTDKIIVCREVRAKVKQEVYSTFLWFKSKRNVRYFDVEEILEKVRICIDWYNYELAKREENFGWDYG